MPSEKLNVYGNMVEENVMYQQLQKIWREKVWHINVFWANLGKFGQISLTPQKTGLLLHL